MLGLHRLAAIEALRVEQFDAVVLDMLFVNSA
jgi:hypothetical protein